MKKKIILLDRDGIINEDLSYVHKIEDIVFLDGIFDLLRVLQEEGYRLYIVTNQSGIGRGYYTEEDLIKLNKWMLGQFKKRDVEIKNIFYCPHVSGDKCACRKPKIGMVKELLKEKDIDHENSWVIGDKDSDTLFGKSLHFKTIRVKSEYDHEVSANFEVDKIIEIKSIIK